MKNRDMLSSVRIGGFKSVATREHTQTVNFEDVTVIIGANGAGKSNLVSFFKMLNMMSTAALQVYLGRQGTATSILHYGPKTTSRVEAEIRFTAVENQDNYRFSLAHASGDRLIFTEESVAWHKAGHSVPHTVDLGVGHSESQLRAKADEGDKTCQVMHRILRNCQVYQFHDTSSESRIRNKVDLANEHFLYSDGGNLAVYLYAMKQSAPVGSKYSNRQKRLDSRMSALWNTGKLGFG
jgi:predicted ATPase